MLKTGFLWAGAAAITWGLVYALDQEILLDIKPITLLFIDSVITAVLVLPLALNSGVGLASLRTSSLQTRLLIVISLALALIANFFIYSGIRALGAPLASIIEIGYPFFVVAFSYFLFGATPSPMSIVGAILIFAGATIVILSR